MTAQETKEPEPIALVGVGCRMPGGVRDLPGLWEFLKNQKDAHMEFTEPRFNAKGFSHPNNDRPGTSVASHGFPLDENPLLFDPSFFGLTDSEVETLDAAQRKLLEVTYEAFENAGETWESVSGTRTGVFVGDISFDNYVSQTRDWDYSTKYSATGSFPNMLANRLHYVFNLKGPSLLINSACTSAMYALHLAVTSIRNGDCDSAIVAGSNWIMDPSSHIAMGKLGALSATSRSHTFDASADGYARGEGFAALYIKKASSAIQDASPIRAFIRGTAVNANGRTTGITNPSGAAQEIVIREAYKHAGVDPSETTLLECHGTGTRVGDPIEVTAAGNVFGPSRPDGFEDRLVVGSVKTNVGHLEGACAFPGILKVVTAIENGAIPPTLGFETPNPRIDFDKAKARVATRVEPWPKDKLKRASVTSAGFGGTNGHCVVDHVNIVLPHYVKPGIIAPSKKLNGVVGNGMNGINRHAGENGSNGINGHNGVNGHDQEVNRNGYVEVNGHDHQVNGNGHLTNGPTPTGDVKRNGHVTNGTTLTVDHHPIVASPAKASTADAGTRQLVVLPFSAHNQTSLKANMSALASTIDQHSLADVAYTLAARRSRYIQRAFAVVDKDDPQATLTADPKVFSSPQPVRLGFVFTGQGAQWHAMGAELLEYSVFRNTISYLDHILGLFPQPVPWKVSDVLSGHCEKDLVQTPAVSQTVCTALQIGLVDLLASWSVRPAGVVGHSSGEMAAAYAAGYVTAAEAITAAYYRGHMVSFNKQKGAMLAAGIGPELGMKYIEEAGYEESVRVAAINSLDSITLSGDADAVEALSIKLGQDGVFNRVLRTGGLAYHSHHMLPLGHDYSDAVEAGQKSLEEHGISHNGQKYPSVPWISSVTPHKEMGPSGQRMSSYWRSNLESPVRFSEALSGLLDSQEANVGALIEIGPHPALKSPAGQIVKAAGKSIPHLPSLTRGQDGGRSVLELAGTLFALHAKVDLVAVNAVDPDESSGKLAHGTMAVDMPPYQYTYGPIKYHESRLSKEYRFRKVPRHDLLGSRIVGTTRLRPQWRNMLRLKDLPWLDDHRVSPHILHPGAAHICMAMVAAEQAYNEFPDALPITGIALRNVSIKKTLVVPDDDHGIEIVLTMEFEDGATGKAPGWATYSISSVVRDTEQWTEHSSGRAKVEVSTFEHVEPINMDIDGRPVDAESWYKRFSDMGLKFGPSFQGYSDIRADPNKNVATARLALNTTEGMFPGGESHYHLHPASLDLAIRLGIMACNGGSSETACIQLPIHLDQLRLKTGSLKGQEWATGVSKGELRGLRGAYAQVQMLGKDGDVVLNVDNMRFIDLANDQGSSSSASQSGKAYSSPYNRLVWRPDIRTLNTAQINTVLSDKTGTFTRLSKIFDLLGHADPDLRILQVGTEEGAAGQAILQTLTGSKGIKRYREYVMSYASKAQLPSEKSEFRDVNHALLDMEEDPLDQGFNPIYDVVVSVRAVQGSEKAQRFLENCKKLLRPGGTLVLLEPSEINWEAPVVQAGLELSAMVAADTDSTLLLATLPHQEAQPEDRSSLIHLLHGTSGMPLLLDRMAHELKGRGLSTKIMGLEDAKSIPAKSRVIAFLDQENLLLDADQHRIELFQHLAANAASMVWLTSCGIVKARNPDAAFVSGLLRTLGTENPSSQFLFMDIDADNFQPPEPEQELDDLVRCIADQELGLHAESSEANRDRAWQDGCMWISRLVPDDNLHDYADAVPAPDDQELELVPLSSQGPLKAAFRTPGILTSLYFKPYVELLKPLQKHEIDVKVLAVGLNWKDLGLCTGRFDLNNFSNEYVGIVTRRGAEVAHVAVGDRVYGMGKGHFGNYTRVPAAIAQRLPFEVGTVDAATMPLVYMTAVYAFEHVTRLRKGQKVLIQSASGGLGLAAIQLAQAKGAEIYATVGNAEKACFLTDEMGIPPTRIFSSRDQADVQRMINATLHGGFDVILSNAQGDMLYESIKSLAPLGHLIDVGRMDVTGSKNVALELFQKSASFTSFDLGLVIDRDLELAGELMQSVHEHFTAGRIRPVRPHTTFDISQLDQALLRFSKGTHIGKLVVTYLDAESMVKKHDSVAPVSFDPEARYILVGGLSELGRSIVRWMSERGARDMVVWSRSGSKNVNAESSALIQDLARSGVSVRPVTCDVSNLEQVKQAVQDASSDRPVRGVFNYAVSYQDIGFDKMTAEMFHGGMAAKVIGSRNLHEATLSMPLDFFTMVSSFGTVVAFPTQSTYLAANNWMEYFARYRRRCGLPASTVSLGFIADVGPLAGDVATVNLVTRAKIELVTAAQVLRMLEPGFKTSVSQSGEHQQWFGQSDDPLSEANIVTGCDPAVLATMKREEPKGLAGLIPRWHRDARASLILRAVDDACRHHAGSDAAKALGDNAADLSPTAQLRQQFQVMLHRLNEKSSDEVEVAKALAFVMQAIRDTVAGMLFIDPSAVNVTGTIADHGIDSLLAAEFRNWLQGAFGKNISMLDLMDARTRIDTLAQSILEGAVEA